MEALKTCSRCGRDKPIDQFDLRMSVKKGPVPRAWCTACNKTSKKTDPDKNRKYQILSRYGISAEEVQELGDQQDWKCYLCGDDISDKPKIDHDHATGMVRKLLCLHCNVGLGHFKDSVDLLEKAIAYLKEHTAERSEDDTTIS